MISLDCETTGLDLRHGAKPFMVQICDGNGVQQWWEWEVQPKNREPIIQYEDLEEIQHAIDVADSIVLQNPKFDVAALQQVFCGRLRWDWSKVYDTLLAGHLLGSNEPHDLTSMALLYLNVNVQPYEEAVKKATKEARRMCQSKDTKYADWRISKPGLPEMPSAKGEVWKNDMWLPRAVAKEEGYTWAGDHEHPWWTVCSDYGNSDSEATLVLFKQQRKLLKERGLWKIYKERLKVLPIVYKMEFRTESRGITLNRKRLQEQQKKYLAESEQSARICVNIAKSYGYDLQLPKSGNNKSLTSFVFSEGGLALEPVKKSKKTGAPSLDKDAMDEYLSSLPKGSKELTFLRSLRSKRKRDTALAYMEGYKKFWLPLRPLSSLGGGRNSERHAETPLPEWYCLYPSLNPTGTHTLRWSSQNPNEQNISKQEGFNLRYCFGPAPGREWWSLDAQNLELRIPAYEANEIEQIKLFEKPNEPPYFGSNHLLVCHILHPKKFEKCVKDGVSFKDRHETEYGYVKNGNFAVQYGAVEQSGTADRAYHVKGAQRKVQARFKRIKELSAKWIHFAEKHGYVETMPDKTVDPEHGYPLKCLRSNYGRILPTIPFNYHVQGTACWWMMKSMIRCQKYLDGLNAVCQEPKYSMIMQIHDELVFDFPKSFVKTTVGKLTNERMPSSGSVYVDRTTKWGNPFLIGHGGTRVGVIEKYEKWIKTQPKLMAALPELCGKKLLCHCFPKPCHADVLAKLAGNSFGNLPKIQRIAKLMEQGGEDLGIPTPVSIEYHSTTWSEGVSV